MKKTKKKQNWFKEHYMLSWIVNCFFLALILVIIANYEYSYLYYHEEEPFHEDSILKEISTNTYQLKIKVNNITISQNFNNASSKALLGIYDENINLITEEFAENITFLGDNGKYYGKITKTVNFTENNASETRYAWILFEVDEDSNDSFDFILNYNPAIWREEPTKKW